MVDVALTFGGLDGNHAAIMLFEEIDEFEEEEEEDPILGMSREKGFVHDLADEFTKTSNENENEFMAFGLPMLVCKRNLPLGFLDAPFATKVLDRFPKKDYKGVPLPEEELPMVSP